MNEELSPEQLEERRDEMKKFYEKSLPYLEAQAKYEKLLTDVEEARYKRATMQLQYASMVAATQAPDLEEESEKENFRTNSQTPRPVAQAPAKGNKLKRG